MLALAARQSAGSPSTVETAHRLHTEAPNTLPTARRRTTLVIAWEVVREPMLLLLMTADTLVMRDGQRQRLSGREEGNGSCPVKIP